MASNKDSYDVIVIGSGIAGAATAIKSSEEGLKVLIIEKDKLGGTCVNVGCVPTKYLLRISEHYNDTKEMTKQGLLSQDVEASLKNIMRRKRELISQVVWWYNDYVFPSYGIEVEHGTARLLSPQKVKVNGTTLSARKAVVVATGSRPSIPPIPGLDESMEKGCVITSNEALSLEEPPDRLLIIGAGPVGLELAAVWNGFGSEIYVIEQMDTILPGLDRDATKALYKILVSKGYNIHLNTRVTHIQGCSVKLSNGDTIRTDKVLVATGRRPNTQGLGLEQVGVALGESGEILVNDRMQTSIPSIYAVGDVTGPPLVASKAKLQGFIAASNISGKEIKYRPTLMPFTVFTDPEIATVGISAYKGDPKYIVKRYPAAVNYRAIVYERPYGLVKVVIDKETKQLRGFHMVGLNASEVVNAATTAILKGLSLDEALDTVFTHPVMSELMLDAMHLLEGYNVYLPRR